MKPWGMTRMFVQSPAATYDSTILADAPAGYWKLDETSGTTAADSSGNGRDGSYVASPTLSAGGCTLNGSSQYVSVPDNAFDVIGAAGQGYTFEIFVTTLAGIAANAAIMDKTKIPSPIDWNLLQCASGAPHFQLYDGAINPIATGGSLVNGTEAVIHAVRDVSAGKIAIYKNGSLITYASASSSLAVANTIDLCIGARQAGTDRFAKIKARRAAVYLYALSSTQIAAHYAARNL